MCNGSLRCNTTDFISPVRYINMEIEWSVPCGHPYGTYILWNIHFGHIDLYAEIPCSSKSGNWNTGYHVIKTIIFNIFYQPHLP